MRKILDGVSLVCTNSNVKIRDVKTINCETDGDTLGAFQESCAWWAGGSLTRANIAIGRAMYRHESIRYYFSQRYHAHAKARIALV